MNLFISFLTTQTDDHSELSEALIKHSKEIGELMNNIFDNLNSIKEKKMAILHRYYDLFVAIIKELVHTSKLKESNSGLKESANKLVK